MAPCLYRIIPLEEYAGVYKDLHQHPELPCQESRTALVVAGHLEALGYQVQRNICRHGVVGILTNGEGRTVLLRSELDTLPIAEETGLPYANKVEQVDMDGYTKRVIHACGHDMHMASLLSAAVLLQKVKSHCCIISRLQMVVAREIDFKAPCAITCGYFHGGTDASIIPEFVGFKVDIRSFDKDIRLAQFETLSTGL